MSDEELDPEVLADLQLRESSQYDPKRTRTARYDWRQPDIVAHWPCRRPGCGQTIGVTQEAVDALRVANERMQQEGEREIPTDAVMICPPCKVVFEDVLAEKAARRRAEIRDLVLRMKESPNPRSEHETIKRLTKLGHPDVVGLIEHLAAKLERNGNKTAKAKGSKL